MIRSGLFETADNAAIVYAARIQLFTDFSGLVHGWIS
jgi:hypothetical protein